MKTPPASNPSLRRLERTWMWFNSFPLVVLAMGKAVPVCESSVWVPLTVPEKLYVSPQCPTEVLNAGLRPGEV